MAAYVVRWEVEVDAETPEEAVEQAVNMLPGNSADTTATVFAVWPEADADDPNCDPITIDLAEIGRAPQR